jgi:hypothetical protein
MHNCNNIRIIIENYLAGELSPSDQELLNQHLSSCADCRELITLHEEMMQMDGDVNDPGPDSMRAMRSRVFAQLSGGRELPAKPLNRPLWALGSVVATAAMLVLGIFLGRSMAVPNGFDDQLLLRAVTQQAKTEHNPDTYWDMPLSFANVSVGEVDGAMVNLDFDVCRSIGLTTSLDSPVAGDVLTHAILNSSSMGGRMQAIELAAHSNNQRLTEALLVTLRHDPDPIMRIEALGALAENGHKQQVQTALLASLRDDQSVQVRMLVLDQLVNQALGLDTLEEVIQQGEGESNSAVYQRARELQNEAPASDWL